MCHILLVPVTAPSQFFCHHIGKFNRIRRGVPSIFFFCPRDITIPVIISLKRQLNAFHIHRSFHFCADQTRLDLLHPALNGIRRIGNPVGLSRKPGIKCPFGTLHRIKSSPATFLHHNRFDQFHIFSNPILCGILTDQRFIDFHFCADSRNRIRISSTRHAKDTSKQNHNQQNQYRNPSPCQKCCYNRFCSCNDCPDSCQRGSGSCLCGLDCCSCRLSGCHRCSFCCLCCCLSQPFCLNCGSLTRLHCIVYCLLRTFDCPAGSFHHSFSGLLPLTPHGFDRFFSGFYGFNGGILKFSCGNPFLLRQLLPGSL